TITGPKQLSTPPGHSALELSFKNEKRLENSSQISFLNQIEKPPAIVIANQSGTSGLMLAGREMSGTSEIRSSLFSEEGGGFGYLSVDNTDGTILVPQGSPLSFQAGGSLALKATNVEILSSITIPGGTLSAIAYNYSPFLYAEQLALEELIGKPAPSIVDGQGVIRVGPSVALSAVGTQYDERLTSVLVSNTRRVLDGGSISLEGYSVLMDSSSSIDASGGLGMSARGKLSKGVGGSISILAGKDPLLNTSSGGRIQLPGILQAYSATKGGSLKIQTPEILLTGKAGDRPVVSQGTRLVLSPDFFTQGGFTDFSLVGVSLAGSENPTVEVAPDTSIHPVAATLGYSRNSNRNGQIAFEPRTLPEGVRSPASLSLEAKGFDDASTSDKIEAIGSMVVGAGSTIQTDPLGKIGLKAQTLEVFGTLNAPAGKISLQADSKFPLSPDAALSNANALITLHLAPSARILAQGTTIFSPDPYGRRTGQVLSGGAIALKGNIVAESGAVLDVSGASDQLDFHPLRLDPTLRPTVGAGLTRTPWGQQAIRVQVDSNGGAIQLQGSQMLLSDATLLGQAGGPSATGGFLSVSSGVFLIQTGADINFIVNQSGRVISSQNSNLGIGKPVLDADGSVIRGMGYFVADQFINGGFDSLDLGNEYFDAASVPFGGNIEFQGPVAIKASGAIRLAAGGVISAAGAVNLTASYVSIGQGFRPPVNPGDIFVPFK
ncbi:hypothetical protein EBU02_12875, partial [bacterium]|nr:hypothetical protein [bacterium]